MSLTLLYSFFSMAVFGFFGSILITIGTNQRNINKQQLGIFFTSCGIFGLFCILIELFSRYF